MVWMSEVENENVGICGISLDVPGRLQFNQNPPSQPFG